MRVLPTILSVGLLLSSFLAFADVDEVCSDEQRVRCLGFCMDHEGMKTCVIEQTALSGACTCMDGTTDIKQK